MADKKNLCAMIPADLHARVRLEQEQSGKTLSEYVEQLITDYYKMKENTKMTGDTRTLAVQIPEELFLRLDAYLKRSGIKSKKQFLISLIEAGWQRGRRKRLRNSPRAGPSRPRMAPKQRPTTSRHRWPRQSRTRIPTKKNNHPAPPQEISAAALFSFTEVIVFIFTPTI